MYCSSYARRYTEAQLSLAKTHLAQRIVERDADETLTVTSLHGDHPFRTVLAENTATLALADAHFLHGRADAGASLLSLRAIEYTFTKVFKISSTLKEEYRLVRSQIRWQTDYLIIEGMFLRLSHVSYLLVGKPLVRAFTAALTQARLISIFL